MVWETKRGGIDGNNVKLPQNYHFKNFTKVSESLFILDFLEKNYKGHKDSVYLRYTEDQFKWYFNDAFNFTVLYENDHIIGCVSGKKENVYIKGVLNEIFEINFLCIDFDYRKTKCIGYLVEEIGRIGLELGLTKGCYISSDNHAVSLTGKIEYYLKYVKQFDHSITKNNFLQINETVSPEVISKLNERNKKEDIVLGRLIKETLFDDKTMIWHTVYDRHGIFEGFVCYHILDVVTSENKDACLIKQANVMYHWVSNNLTLPVLLELSFNFLGMSAIDTIVCDSSSVFKKPELREKLNINITLSNHTYYYLYDYYDSVDPLFDHKLSIYFP